MYFPSYTNIRMSDTYIPMCSDLPQKLLKAMKGEHDARSYYEQLINIAPSQQDKKIISTFLEDEKKHFSNFRRLYIQITGKQPMLPELEIPNIPTYIAGIEKSIFDETDAYEFYRNTFLCTNSPIAKEIFLEAFTDENEHATRLNYLFAKNK